MAREEEEGEGAAALRPYEKDFTALRGHCSSLRVCRSGHYSDRPTKSRRTMPVETQ